MDMRDAFATSPVIWTRVLSPQLAGLDRYMRGPTMTSYANEAAFLSDSHAATCATVFIHIAQAPATHAAVGQSSSEDTRLILDFYGFSKSELAKIMGVSRPALYAWLDASSEPSRENAGRLGILAGMARELDPKATRPLFHGYIDRPIPGYSRSLLDMLMEAPSDLAPVRKLIAGILGMTRDRERRISAARSIADISRPSQETQERNLEDNLSAIGTEG